VKSHLVSEIFAQDPARTVDGAIREKAEASSGKANSRPSQRRLGESGAEEDPCQRNPSEGRFRLKAKPPLQALPDATVDQDELPVAGLDDMPAWLRHVELADSGSRALSLVRL
jgi:hypothetical protein